MLNDLADCCFDFIGKFQTQSWFLFFVICNRGIEFI